VLQVEAMKWSERQVGDAVVATVAGRVDLTNADALRDQMTEALKKTKAALVLDLSGVDYMSSAGLRSLMIVFKAAKAEGKALGLAGLQPLLLEIFTISRFHLVFPLFDSVADATAKLAPGRT
jgi:anti-sigma B factor antagonist/stage II sporulation protein AA (anti-sigma F factor antagonist)